MAELATTWSPAPAMLKTAKKFAAWPELVSMAAVPPSSSAMLCGNVVVGGVLQAGVEVAGLLKVEQATHMLGGVVFPGGGLVDRNLARLCVAGAVAALYAGGADTFGHAIPRCRVQGAQKGARGLYASEPL